MTWFRGRGYHLCSQKGAIHCERKTDGPFSMCHCNCFHEAEEWSCLVPAWEGMCINACLWHGTASNAGQGDLKWTTLNWILEELSRRPDRLWAPLGPTRPSIPFVPGILSLEVKRPGRIADQSLAFNAGVKNGWSYTCTTPNIFTARRLVKHSDKSTFTTFTFINNYKDCVSL